MIDAERVPVEAQTVHDRGDALDVAVLLLGLDASGQVIAEGVPAPVEQAVVLRDRVLGPAVQLGRRGGDYRGGTTLSLTLSLTSYFITCEGG